MLTPVATGFLKFHSPGFPHTSASVSSPLHTDAILLGSPAFFPDLFSAGIPPFLQGIMVVDTSGFLVGIIHPQFNNIVWISHPLTWSGK